MQYTLRSGNHGQSSDSVIMPKSNASIIGLAQLTVWLFAPLSQSLHHHKVLLVLDTFAVVVCEVPDYDEIIFLLYIRQPTS